MTPRGADSRWPVLAAMGVALVIPFLMPASFVAGPGFLLPGVEGALLVAVAIVDPGRIDRRSRGARRIRRTFIIILIFAAAWATGSLVDDIVSSGPETSSATALLWAGGLVWIYTVLAFGFLYWEFDSGGPGERAHRMADYPDLAFQQQVNPHLAPAGWRPVFNDYLYLGLTNALAFSPTDVMPLAVWAKLVMGVQSMISLLILGLVIARAVNVLS